MFLQLCKKYFFFFFVNYWRHTLPIRYFRFYVTFIANIRMQEYYILLKIPTSKVLTLQCSKLSDHSIFETLAVKKERNTDYDLLYNARTHFCSPSRRISPWYLRLKTTAKRPTDRERKEKEETDISASKIFRQVRHLENHFPYFWSLLSIVNKPPTKRASTKQFDLTRSPGSNNGPTLALYGRQNRSWFFRRYKAIRATLFSSISFPRPRPFHHLLPLPVIDQRSLCFLLFPYTRAHTHTHTYTYVHCFAFIIFFF